MKPEARWKHSPSNLEDLEAGVWWARILELLRPGSASERPERRAFADGHVISRHINGMNRMVYGFDFIPGTSVYVCHCWIVHQGSLVVNVRRRCDWKLLLKVNGSEYEMSRESPKTTWILYDFVVCKCLNHGSQESQVLGLLASSRWVLGRAFATLGRYLRGRQQRASRGFELAIETPGALESRKACVLLFGSDDAGK